MNARACLIALALGAWACAGPVPVGDEPATPSGEAGADPAPPAVAATAGADAPAADDRASLACAEELARLGEEAELPGAPVFEARRYETLARAKASPVLLMRAPEADAGGGREGETYRQSLATSSAPAWQLHLLSPFIGHRQELARSLFLREHYLYADSPALAAAITEWVELADLFREPELVIERGATRLGAKRTRLGYEYVEGPERGQRARLLLLDRVWVKGEEPGPALHREVESARAQLGYDDLEIVRQTASGIVARARYGDVVLDAALLGAGPALDSSCVVVPASQARAVASARARALRARRAVQQERVAIDAMVQEALPFDEPRTEDGQQDGNLRPAWRWAYLHGWDSYEFNDDTYQVFDARGRPQVPQVCIDFVTDTFERASGTWFKARGSQRERARGLLDFDDLGVENRRSVENFVGFAWGRPEWFEVVDLTPEERVPFQRHGDFYRHLYEHRDRYREGDVIAIHGYRSDGQMHYHSFIVYDSDPITGMPTLVAANAGRPRVRTWEQEMRAAPLRSIRHRVRPRLEWLESIGMTRL